MLQCGVLWFSVQPTMPSSTTLHSTSPSNLFWWEQWSWPSPWYISCCPFETRSKCWAGKLGGLFEVLLKTSKWHTKSSTLCSPICIIRTIYLYCAFRDVCTEQAECSKHVPLVWKGFLSVPRKTWPWWQMVQAGLAALGLSLKKVGAPNSVGKRGNW